MESTNTSIASSAGPTGKFNWAGNLFGAGILLVAFAFVFWGIHVKLDSDLAVEVVEEVVVVEAHISYLDSCKANSILAESFATCLNHHRCTLTIDETAMMYHAGKAAIIDCKKSEMLLKFFEEYKERKPWPLPPINPEEDKKDI